MIALLVAVAIGLAYDQRIAAVFVVRRRSWCSCCCAARLALMAARAHLPRARSTMLRLAVANIHRPGALTPTVVLSLGLGLALLVTVIEIDGNLRRQFMAALPEQAPSFYLHRHPVDRDRTLRRLRASSRRRRATLEHVPMLRGRIVSARGVKAEDIKPSPDAAWVLQSDRGITYAADSPEGLALVEGQWWAPDYRGPPLVSFEKKLADGLGLKLGDDVVVNVLGRNITATIANLRTVDWQSLGINFVLVFSPNAFAGAPHTHIATLT